ncbi:MAG: MarR family transcriptional regulator [Bifidobacteriaceae bacterium]|jgi:DNA-binding MarR family transcriptional regulator|nr:MarR family transcriptional regulator [Bifidobacteriaceae bacterium]MCI1978896.1 MarR family transcriptional regulator [Bifidobacteriaceae bacterium]
MTDTTHVSQHTQSAQKKSQRPENYSRLLKQTTNQLNRSFDEFAAHYGLTGNQMSVIDFLSTRPGNAAEQRDIEIEFDIRRSSVTTMLQRMERKGLLIREQAPDDARRKIVRLTAEANKLISVVTEYIDSEQRLFEERFGESRIADLKRMLAFFVDHRTEESRKRNLQ